MSKRVLVVDDEEDVRTFVRLVLESEGYEVQSAADGAEGLRAIAEGRPDLVILDLMMPVMDGWQVLEKVGGQHPPFIVILSAAANPERAFAAGAVATVSKPFKMREFLDVCRRALESPTSAR
jgi:CheY-like chemotaxis protein